MCILVCKLSTKPLTLRLVSSLCSTLTPSTHLWCVGKALVRSKPSTSNPRPPPNTECCSVPPNSSTAAQPPLLPILPIAFVKAALAQQPSWKGQKEASPLPGMDGDAAALHVTRLPSPSDDCLTIRHHCCWLKDCKEHLSSGRQHHLRHIIARPCKCRAMPSRLSQDPPLTPHTRRSRTGQKSLSTASIQSFVRACLLLLLCVGGHSAFRLASSRQAKPLPTTSNMAHVVSVFDCGI